MAREAPSARPLIFPLPLTYSALTHGLPVSACLRRAHSFRRGCSTRRSPRRRSDHPAPCLVVRAQGCRRLSSTPCSSSPTTSSCVFISQPLPCIVTFFGVFDAFLIFGILAYSPPAETRVSYPLFAGFLPSYSLSHLTVLLRLLSCHCLKFRCAPRCLPLVPALRPCVCPQVTLRRPWPQPRLWAPRHGRQELLLNRQSGPRWGYSFCFRRWKHNPGGVAPSLRK